MLTDIKLAHQAEQISMLLGFRLLRMLAPKLRLIKLATSWLLLGFY